QDETLPVSVMVFAPMSILWASAGLAASLAMASVPMLATASAIVTVFRLIFIAGFSFSAGRMAGGPVCPGQWLNDIRGGRCGLASRPWQDGTKDVPSTGCAGFPAGRVR